MANIKVREFKGLKTYIDPADIDNGYFNTFENLRPKIGYTEAKSLEATLDTSIIIPSGETLILYDYVFLDEDKQKNYYDPDTNKLIYGYEQKLEKYKIIITYRKQVIPAYYQIYLIKDGTTDTDKISVGRHVSDEVNQYPYIINEKGICKILFKDQSYWLGKINRNRWNSYGTIDTFTSQFVLYPIVSSLMKTNDFVTLSFVEGDGTIRISELQDLIRREIKYTEHPQWGVQMRIGFYKKNTIGEEEFVKINTSDGYLWVLRTNMVDAGMPIGLMFYTDALSLIPNPNDISLADDRRWRLGEVTSPRTIVDYITKEVKGEVPAGKYFFAGGENTPRDYEKAADYWSTEVVNRVDGGYQETLVATDKGISAQEPYTEYIVTAIIEQNEFPIRFFSYQADVSKPYIVKLESLINQYFPEKNVSALVFYFRSGTDATSIKSKDFEQFWTLSLLSNDKPKTIYALTSLSSNGIFLTQTIGKALDPDTYKIETVFDDYLNVNGVPFILKNDNVLYPVVGNGIVHTDMFYPENYVPQVTGKYLTILENKLAVFEENKEEMTYVDFQSVEGQLIFFVRGSATYRIKDYWDLIETPEGIIINLPDGIYATNGETRSLISLPINNIMKDNYLSSSIYYNSYEKEVLYVCTQGIYVYRFETDSWSKMDFIGPDPTSSTVIDIVDDYEGHMWMVLTDNKIYKIEYKDAIGKFGLTYIDLQELAVAKRLNWIAVDAVGKVNDIPTTESGLRKVLFFNNMLKDRKPSQWLDFLFEVGYLVRDDMTKVTGTIYNLEMNFEAFSIRKT